MIKAPEVLDKITDLVLAFRPKAKTKQAKVRARKVKKIKADAKR